MLAVWGGQAAAEDRVALVIGNAAYRHVEALDNPDNDAQDMARALTSEGFEVFTGLDLSRAGMMELIDRFAAAAEDAEVALFFFAGHAFQVGGQNYLIPVDLDPGEGERTLEQGISLDIVMDLLEAAPACGWFSWMPAATTRLGSRCLPAARGWRVSGAAPIS